MAGSNSELTSERGETTAGLDRTAEPGYFGTVAESLARRIDRRQLFKRTLGFVFSGVAGVLVEGSIGALNAEASSCCSPPGGTWCPGADCNNIGSSCFNGCQPDTQYWSPGNCWTTICGGRAWTCCDCWCPNGPCSFYACGCEYASGHLLQGFVPDSPRMVHPADRPLVKEIPNCAPQS